MTKIIGLVFVSVLLTGSFMAFAQISPINSVQNFQKRGTFFDPPKSNVSILNENFSDASMPPSGWSLDTTNSDGTWEADSARHHSDPYSGSVWRGPDCHGLQDEWLITPEMNFSQYVNPTHSNRIFLQFWWYTDVYVVQHSLIQFNVSVSTNGGTNWTRIWAAKDQSGFPEYAFSLIGMPIEISEYRNETNVKIGFQFFSNTEEEAIAQYFAIDDIFLTTESIDTSNFSCNAGGPYDWYFYRQLDYYPNGVRFHGDVNDSFNPLLCQWLWDFGNGNTSKVPLNTWNCYNKTGVFNITLQVTYGDLVSFANTTVRIFLMAPPDLDVTLNSVSMPGIQATIDNPGDFNATNVNWSIKVFLGPLKMREKLVATGNLSNINAHATAQIKSKYFFGSRLIRVEIVVTPENIYGTDKSFYALKIGPFILALSQVT